MRIEEALSIYLLAVLVLMFSAGVSRARAGSVSLWNCGYQWQNKQWCVTELDIYYGYQDSCGGAVVTSTEHKQYAVARACAPGSGETVCADMSMPQADMSDAILVGGAAYTQGTCYYNEVAAMLGLLPPDACGFYYYTSTGADGKEYACYGGISRTCDGALWVDVSISPYADPSVAPQCVEALLIGSIDNAVDSGLDIDYGSGTAVYNGADGLYGYDSSSGTYIVNTSGADVIYNGATGEVIYNGPAGGGPGGGGSGGVCEDKDGDGHYAISAACPEGDDCDDNDGDMFPGNAEICDGKDNDCDGQTDEGVISSASSNLASVWPKDTGGNDKAQIEISLNHPAGDGCEIELEVDADTHLKSGGHDHHGPNDGRPKGTLNDYDVLIGVGKTSGLVTYHSNIVSGTEDIKYRVKRPAPTVTVTQSGNTVTATGGASAWDGAVTIDVMVPGLAGLGSSNYTLKCNIYSCAGYKHTDFYNVVPWVEGSFDYIAFEYHKKFPNDKKLIVNDGSLKWGGLYDYRNTWRPPHSTHRIGTDIDVRSADIPIKNRTDFKKIACRNFVYPNLEYPGQAGKEHYHLYFVPYIKDHYNLCKGYY